jgi:hypothetical protein
MAAHAANCGTCRFAAAYKNIAYAFWAVNTGTNRNITFFGCY